jgi:hypothetical protein
MHLRRSQIIQVVAWYFEHYPSAVKSYHKTLLVSYKLSSYAN